MHHDSSVVFHASRLRKVAGFLAKKYDIVVELK